MTCPRCGRDPFHGRSHPMWNCGSFDDGEFRQSESCYLAELENRIIVLRTAIQLAMNEIGVPRSGHPKRAAVAYEILKSIQEDEA